MSPDQERHLRETVASVLEIEPGEVMDDTSPDTVVGWDSLAHLNLILALEDAFAVTIPDEEAADMSSVALIRLVLREQLEPSGDV